MLWGQQTWLHSEAIWELCFLLDLALFVSFLIESVLSYFYGLFQRILKLEEVVGTPNFIASQKDGGLGTSLELASKVRAVLWGTALKSVESDDNFQGLSSEFNWPKYAQLGVRQKNQVTKFGSVNTHILNFILPYRSWDFGKQSTSAGNLLKFQKSGL